MSCKECEERRRLAREALLRSAVGEAAVIVATLKQLREKEEECKERVRTRLTAVVASHSQRLTAVLQQLGYLESL